MEWRLNSGDHEQCLHGANVSAGGCVPCDVTAPADKCYMTSVDSSVVGQRGCILRSLLSRPINDLSRDDSHMSTEDGGQCQAVVGGVGHRPRSRSMGTTWWTIPEVASPSSQDSLDCADDLRLRGSGGETQASSFDTESLHTDRLIEVARCKLMTLQTSDEYSSSFKSRLSYSHPGTPPRTDVWTSEKLRQHRKYSEGSRLKACLQGLRTGFRTPDSSELHPVDFSCRRRKKFEGISGLPYARPLPGYPVSNTSTDEGLGDDCSSEQSILKSILTGRGRSNTISACGTRSCYDALGNCTNQSQQVARQPVTLAKKNLHPVMAKINDCVNQVITFYFCMRTCWQARVPYYIIQINNNDKHDNVYGAVIMAEPLREFTRFI